MGQDLFNKTLEIEHKAVDKFVSYANTNKAKLGKDIVSGILLVIIFGLFGCFDFVSLSFKFEYLMQVSYWTRTITKAIAGICAYHIGINFSWDREIEKDMQLEEQSRKYDRLIKLKDQKTFNTYVVEVLNPQEKRKAYIAKINKKIYWLNRFARHKDKLLYSSDDEKDNEKKLKNRYCIKRTELEKLKSDEYIEKNFNSLDVKYNYIDPIIFDLEIDGKSSYKGYKVKGSVAVGKARRTTTTFASMILVSMFITSIGIGANSEEFEKQLQSFWYWLLTTFSDVGIIIWKVIQGFFASRKIIAEEITLPITHRNQILEKYIEWCAVNNIEISKAKQIYDKIVQEEERLKSVA